MMVINRSLTKSASWSAIGGFEGSASDGVIEWGVDMVLKGRGDGEG